MKTKQTNQEEEMKANGDVKNKIVSALFSRPDQQGGEKKHSQETDGTVNVTAVRRDLGGQRRVLLRGAAVRKRPLPCDCHMHPGKES